MILFDTETTGLPLPEASPVTKQPQIIEIAVIKANDKTLEIEEEYNELIKPTIHISPEITKITGITNEDLKDKKPFASHYPRLSNMFIGERHLVAHNVSFDRSLLIYELMRLGRLTRFPWPPNHICTVVASKSIRGHRLKLGVLYEMATGKPLKDAHRAINDTRALLECVRWLKKEGILSWE